MTLTTATELTKEHYQRPEVKEIICRHALLADDSWRALNGDFSRWYRYTNGDARLLNAKEDYNHLTGQFRTLYQTLNVFDPSLWMVSRPKEEITQKNPLGTPADTVAYTLGTDIDVRDIENPDDRKAGEDAGQFLIDYLKENGIHESVWPLFSGCGIYVKIHHEICKPESPEDRAKFFGSRTGQYNRLIGHVSEEFFKVHPEHKGAVKFDELNNSKRVFKCILSIHKKRPYAVTPLNRDAIKIDLERAQVPLKDDMIEEAREWYSSFDPAEREPLLKLLDEFKESEGSVQKREFNEIWRSPTKIDEEHFPPCVRHIIETENSGEGKTRFSGVLAAFLYQMGWDVDEACDLVMKVSDRNGLSNAEHIFDSCYGRVFCPACEKIKNDAAAYPHLGLKDLGACKPDANCNGCQWPGGCAIAKLLQKTKSEQEAKSHNPTVIDAPTFTQEQLTKAIGKIIKIDPETGEAILDDKDKPVLVPKLTLSPTKAAASITHAMILRLSETDTSDKPKIWRFGGDIWKPDGEKKIMTAIDDAVGDLSYEKGLKETIRRVRSLTKAVAFDSNPYLFPSQDGVIDLKTGVFREYQPEDYLTFKYGAAFNLPGADYRPLLWFLCSSLPDPRDVVTVIDIITAIALRVPFDTIVLLFGGGSNGKGILEKVILALFTMTRSTAITLEEMSHSRFGPGALLSKDVWIVSEVESVEDAMSSMKKIATGELIDSDVKYGDRVQGRPHVLQILDANKAFDFGDDSYGRKRRVIKLDFPYEFGDEDHQMPIDRHLEEKLTRPEVLSGLLRIIAARAPDLARSKKIYRRKTAKEMAEEFDRQRFSSLYFCDECLSTEPLKNESGKYIALDGKVILDDKGERIREPPHLKVDDAYDAYMEYCQLYNVTTPDSKRQFGKRIHEKYSVSSAVSTENKGSYRYYPGIYLVRSVKAAYADNKLDSGGSAKTTDASGKLQMTLEKLQINQEKLQISPLKLQIEKEKTISVDGSVVKTTDKLLSEVSDEINRMFEFIESCENVRDISYERYLEKCNLSVVSVVTCQPLSNRKISSVVSKNPICSRMVADTDSETTDDPASVVGSVVQHAATPSDENVPVDALAVSKETCAVCSADISDNHGRYGKDLCPDCGSRRSVTEEAVKSLHQGFTIENLLEALAAKGHRPLPEKHLPAMLRYLGYTEIEGARWCNAPVGAAPQPDQILGGTGATGPNGSMEVTA